MKRILLFLVLFMLIPNIYASEAVIDITTMNIDQIQSSIDKGIITYEQLTSLYLERIDAYDDKYNAISYVNEEAITRAKELDQEYQEKGRRSPLHGIPVVVKDNIDVYSFPTTASSRVLINNYPKENAIIIQKLLDAGAIIIAKARMSEFAFSASNSYNSFGNVYNAYNDFYTPYGSSGGVAVAVALSFAQVGIGTDTNSSIRTPAAAANLIGLRPTFGTVDTSGIIPYDAERDIAGPLTKYSTDAIYVMNVITDAKLNTKKVNDLSEYKIGFLKELYKENSTSTNRFTTSTYAPIVSLMNNLYDLYEESGAAVKEINDLYNAEMFNIRESSVTGVLFCYDFNQYIKGTDGPIKSYEDMLKGSFTADLNYYNESCYSDYRNTSSFAKKVADKAKFKKYILDLMDENNVDYLIYPTTKNKVSKISDGVTVLSNSPLISPTTGMPAINLQLGFIDEMPYGYEIVGRDMSDEKLLEIAKYYESKTNLYKGVPTALSLYEITNEEKELLELYNKYYDNKLYNHINEKAAVVLQKVEKEKMSSISNEYKNYTPPVVDVIVSKFQTDYFLMGSLFVIVILVVSIAYNYLKLRASRKKIINKKK